MTSKQQTIALVSKYSRFTISDILNKTNTVNHPCRFTDVSKERVLEVLNSLPDDVQLTVTLHDTINAIVIKE